VDDEDNWTTTSSGIFFKPDGADTWTRLSGVGQVTVSLHTDDPAPFAGDVRDMRKIDGTANMVFTTKPTSFDPVSVWARRSAEITFPEIEPELLAEITALL
jgi:hypothetical protein